MPVLREGQKIRDTYVVDRFLGEGAFAEVYRVEHRFLGRQAMKVFKSAGMSLDEIEEMLGEALLLSRIRHPNIVCVFDANLIEARDETFGYFTMEYVPGGTLDRYWQSYRERFMPVEEAVEILKQVCAGIAVAHAEDPPIIHRDIKPQNILIGYDGSGMRVRVSDFGLAKRVNPLTMLASAQGTLSFKPPESFENMDSRAADVWALGTTLYLLLTDTLPHPSLAERDIHDGTRFLRPLRPPSIYNIQVNPALDAIISRCLEPDPENRYPDAPALLQDLRSWKPGESSMSSSSKGTEKTVLGEQSSPDRRAAKRSIKEALNLARDPAKLVEAADILEEAINKDASLRGEYESTLKLWRRGVCM